jgi:hypothetical protein
MEDTGLSQEEEEFQWDGWLKPFRRIFLGKPVVEVATYSVMFVIVYYFDVLLYYILNEFAHDALNAKSDLQRSYGIEVR